MKRIATGILTAVLAVSTLAACGSDDEESADEQSATHGPSSATPEPTDESSVADVLADTDFGEPASGDPIKGTGYTYRLPAGWGDVTEAAAARQVAVDTAAAEAKQTGGFQDNVTVLVQDVPAGTVLADLAAAVPGQLEASVEELTEHPRVVLAGVPALHHGGPARQGEVAFFLDEYVALAGQTVTTITFSFSAGLSPEKREAVVHAVLASWTWR